MIMVSILLLICVGIIAFMIFKSASSEHRKTESQHDPTLDHDDRMKSLETETRRIQAFIQANIVGDRFVSDAINGGTYTGPLPERRSDGGWLSIFDNLRILNIAGINYCKNIGKYVGRVECELVPEPENQYDPFAIKIVAEDGHHLGYIPSPQTDFVRSLTANEFPYHCTVFIDEHEDEDDGHKFFTGFVYIKRLD